MAIISASDLKSHLGISDTTDDTTLTTAASAASRAVQRWCGREFDTTTTGSASARVFHPRSQTLTITDDFWSTTNLVVKTETTDDATYGTTLTINTDFIVEPLNGREDGITVPYRRLRATSWLFTTTSTVPSVQVTAAWGWASIPDDVKQAALILGARVWKRKNSPEGVLGGFQDFGAVRISSRQDPDVVNLLSDYRRAETALYT